MAGSAPKSDTLAPQSSTPFLGETTQAVAATSTNDTGTAANVYGESIGGSTTAAYESTVSGF